jgi:outer membrane immunogenic protein
MELDGAMLGGQVGAQYHFKGGIVVGVEADYSVGNLSQMVRDGNFITQTGEIEWTGTLRARAGLPMGAWMPYLTAGYMWAGASYNQQCPDKAAAIPVSPGSHCAKADKYSVTRDATHTGFVYGGGLEVMVSNNFSVKAEGLWFNLSEETYAMGPAPLTGVAIGNKVIEYEGAMFRIGGNYRF